jgi:hypothetical protein
MKTKWQCTAPMVTCKKSSECGSGGVKPAVQDVG